MNPQWVFGLKIHAAQNFPLTEYESIDQERQDFTKAKLFFNTLKNEWYPDAVFMFEVHNYIHVLSPPTN